jgi:hypothetical protein
LCACEVAEESERSQDVSAILFIYVFLFFENSHRQLLSTKPTLWFYWRESWLAEFSTVLETPLNLDDLYHFDSIPFDDTDNPMVVDNEEYEDAR